MEMMRVLAMTCSIEIQMYTAHKLITCESEANVLTRAMGTPYPISEGVGLRSPSPNIEAHRKRCTCMFFVRAPVLEFHQFIVELGR